MTCLALIVSLLLAAPESIVQAITDVAHAVAKGIVTV